MPVVSSGCCHFRQQGGASAGFLRAGPVELSNVAVVQAGEEASLNIIQTKATSPAQAAHPQRSTHTEWWERDPK